MDVVLLLERVCCFSHYIFANDLDMIMLLVESDFDGVIVVVVSGERGSLLLLVESGVHGEFVVAP